MQDFMSFAFNPLLGGFHDPVFLDAPAPPRRGPTQRRPRKSLLTIHKEIERSDRQRHARYIDGDPTKGVRPEVFAR